MGQSSPINSEWKTGCIIQSNKIKESSWCEPAMMKKTGMSQVPAIPRLYACWEQVIPKSFLSITSSSFSNWVYKVGTTSNSDVKQKEKKP